MLIRLFAVICLAFKANAFHINVHGDSTVKYGEDASFTCTVPSPTGVLQVTWQRPSKNEKIENLATFSKQFGEQVNEPYRGKVYFTEKSLNSSSITLRNATWEDERCYICAFNVFPDGSKRKQVCLTVQGISDVNTSHVPSNKPETESRREEFSCSATGKPPPSIGWDVSPGAEIKTQTQTSEVRNSDDTVTSSSSITLEIPADWTGHVDCLLNEDRRESIINYQKEETTDKGKSHIALVIVAVVVASCVVLVVVLMRNRLKKKQQRRECIP